MYSDRTVICTIASITVTTNTLASWLKHRVKNISSSLLVQQKSSQLCITLKSLKIPQLLHLWNEAPIFGRVFSLTQSKSLFLHFFSLSVFLFLLFDVGNGGAFLALLLLSVLRHCLQFELKRIWPGKSRHCTCAGEGHCPVCPVWGRRAASSICTEWLTLLRHAPWLWLVLLIRSCGFLQIKLGPLGGATDSGFLHSWPVNYFYCQIIMTILANTTEFS